MNAKTNQEAARHLRLVLAQEAPACRFAGGEHGPCGGPSNGRECWDHKSIGRGI